MNQLDEKQKRIDAMPSVGIADGAAVSAPALRFVDESGRVSLRRKTISFCTRHSVRLPLEASSIAIIT